MRSMLARSSGLGVLVAAVGLVGACSITLEDLFPPLNVAPYVQARLIAPAVTPRSLAVLPDGRVFFTEKNTGQVRVISNGVLLSTAFVDLPVNAAGDRGLLGIAVHPQFNINHRVYVFYTRSVTGEDSASAANGLEHRIVYFNASGDVASGGEVFVASIPVAVDGRRVGGNITFATDATLLVAVGDQGEDAAAADNASLFGKVLRYNDDGTIPADNPIAGSPVYARGLRHPQGITTDPVTGNVFLLDRNAGRVHEINLLRAGRDFGWPAVAGIATSAAELAYAAANPAYADPVLDSGSGSSPFVGVAFNPSAKYGQSTAGDLFYGLAADKVVNSAEVGGTRDRVDSVAEFAHGFPEQIVDLAFSPAGTLYVATFGGVYRLDTFSR
ncbi:MAG: PQQ-dependent sugar dehydrogenase [Phycisphaerales bacterium]|nr:PQQ-dependent sugar dehydrogenase [Phycisphaerales bacterium]